jgi:hypothetical protein
MLHNQKQKFGLPENVQENARMVDVDGDGRTLLLANGDKLEVDAVIFCTGYVCKLSFKCSRALQLIILIHNFQTKLHFATKT